MNANERKNDIITNQPHQKINSDSINDEKSRNFEAKPEINQNQNQSKNLNTHNPDSFNISLVKNTSFLNNASEKKSNESFEIFFKNDKKNPNNKTVLNKISVFSDKIENIKISNESSPNETNKNNSFYLKEGDLNLKLVSDQDLLNNINHNHYNNSIRVQEKKYEDIEKK